MKEIFDSIFAKLDSADGHGDMAQKMNGFAWMFFYRYLGQYDIRKQKNARLSGETYIPLIPFEFTWDEISKINNDSFLGHINGPFFTYFKTQAVTGNPLSILARRIFHNVDNYIRSSIQLKEVFTEFEKIIFTDNNLPLIREQFEKLLYELTKGNSQSKEYTHRVLVDMVVSLIDIQKNESSFDPAFGTGGFLRALHHKQNQFNLNEVDSTFFRKDAVNGNEKDRLRYALALINLLIDKVDYGNLERINSLERDFTQYDGTKYNVIVTNPDFNSDEAENLASNFPIRVAATDLMFFQSAITRLKSGGRCAIFMPAGFLFRTNGDYFDVKKDFLGNNTLDAIIEFPQVSGKAMTSILIFRAGGKTEKVWFYDLPLKEGESITSNLNSFFKPSHFEELLELYPEKKDSENSFTVDIGQIVTAQYNLQISAYDKREKVHEVLLSPEEYIDMIDDLLDSAKLNIQSLKKEFVQ